MSLTARETEIVALAVQCCKDIGGFKVDYDKLAEKGNFKNSASAATAWSIVKKKLFAANTGTAGPSTPNPKAAHGKSTAETGAGGSANSDDPEEGGKSTPANTPTKKKRATKGKRPFNLTTVSSEGEEVTPKKTGKKAMKPEDNELVTPGAVGDVATPKKAGKKAMKLEDNELVTPGAVGDVVTPKKAAKKAAKKAVKPQDYEAGVTGPVDSTPSKKRGRKPDDAKPSPKRAKKTATDTTASATGNHGSNITDKPSTTAPIDEDDEEYEPQYDPVLPADLEEEILQAASDGLLHPSTNAEKSQGN